MRVARRGMLAGLAALAVAAPAATDSPGRLATPFALADLPGSPLRPLGGLEIDRERLGFGGLSGLHVAPDLTLTVVSDLGWHAAFSLRLDADCRPAALVPRRMGRLKDGAGRPLPRGHAADAEALARLPDGAWLVAFERWHRIRRHRDLDGPGEHVPAPPGLERAPANAGLESLTVLADGSWLAIAEDLPLPDAPGATAAWRGGPGGWMPLGWRPAPGMAPTDAAALPDGGVLVVERGFSWLGGFSGRVVRLGAAALAAAGPGTVLEGEALLQIAAPLPLDNYEAVAVVVHRGKMLVALLSDDNQSRWQRTLLLLFELIG